ncbi:MAG: ABC transporter permease subunit, partial [Caldilineaceae bacterium]|nr:ABC transporter permease subunit [Caldilineaceae bacterium]
ARPIAQITRMTFLTLGHVLEQDYIRTAVGKGLSRPRIIAFHVMRNGAVPILTTIGLSLRLALSSLPVVELFFGWPGAGFMLLKAIAGHDLNLAIALLLIFGLIFVLLSMLLEVGYFWADPRLRALSALPASRGRSVRLAFDGWRAGSSQGSRLPALRDWVAGLREEFSWASWTNSWQSLRGHAQEDGFARTQTASTRRRGIANWPLWLGALIIAALGLVLLFGPQLARHSPYTTQGMEYVDGVLSIPPFAPDAVYPWGTDVLGRDIQSLVLAGARQTLALAALAVGLRMVIGVALGLAAGWWSASPLDRFIAGVASVLAAFPTLILVMLLILILGIRGGFRPFVLGLGLVGWGEIMQFVRGEVIALRPKPFLESAVAVGASTSRIIGRHIMPNLLPAFVSLIALELGAVLMLLGELGFVGIFIGGGAFAELVIDAPKYHYSDVPEWGALLSNVRLYARVYPWTAIYPALGFFVAILGFNLLGEGVRRLVDAGALHLDRLANRFVLVGALVAVVMQPEIITAFANDPSLGYGLSALKSVWWVMADGFVSTTGYEQIDTLFSGGGMSSMLSTVWLILGAMSFGAMMDFGGFNTRLIAPIIGRIKSVGGTIATVMLTSLGLNIVGGDQYIAIVLPARMFLVEFRNRGIHPETLATAVENSGTVTSPLIPWNSCGAYMSAALGVSTFVYFPYCFFNFANFLLGMIYGFVGINVLRLDPEEFPEIESLPVAPAVDLQK